MADVKILRLHAARCRKEMLARLAQITRDTEGGILQAGFVFKAISRESMRGVPPIVRPSIWGEAIKV